MLTLVLSVSFALFVSTLCSLLESVLYSTPMISLEAADDSPAVRTMIAFKKEVDRPLSAILILNTIAHTAGAALAGWAAGEVWGAGSLWVFSVVFTLAILLFSEIIPKTVGAVYWRILWRPSVWPLKLMINLLLPLIWLCKGVTRLIVSDSCQSEEVSETEILAAAKLGAEGGEISPLEAEMINNIIGLEEMRAENIMTPRTVMFSLDGDLALSEVVEQAMEWEHSRVPVWQGEPENVVGYILKNQVLGARDGELDLKLRDLAKPVHFVPASANALNMLRSFLQRREQFSLVVDEYGGLMGILSLEDILEEVVGSEIVDESDIIADKQVLAKARGHKVLVSTAETE